MQPNESTEHMAVLSEVYLHSVKFVFTLCLLVVFTLSLESVFTVNSVKRWYLISV